MEDWRAKKEREKKYWDAEESFFHWLEDNTEVLMLNDLESSFFRVVKRSTKVYSRVNRGGMRLVARFIDKDSAKICEEKTEKLMNLFKETFPTRKRVPVYFPKIFNNVEYVTTTECEAYETKTYRKNKLKPNEIFVWYAMRFNDDNEEETRKIMQDYSDRLNVLGYTNTVTEKDRSLKIEMDLLTLMQKQDAEELSIKRRSGTQYFCRIKEAFKDRSERHQFGLIILSSDSTDATISRSKQACRRSDYIERNKNEVYIIDRHGMIPTLFKLYKMK